MHIAVAIDGPAGAGKSTIARAAAAKLGYIYVDTGALYRAVAWYVVDRGIDPQDSPAVIAALPGLQLDLRYIDGVQRVFVGERDVSDFIRTPEMSMGSSAVSALPEVRDFLMETQRSLARRNDVIMDGRDIGTVVLPDAQVKVYLTASAQVRARRRHTELAQKGEQMTYEQILADIEQRDYNDSHRAVAPLKRADDAHLLDTGEMDIQQSVAALVALIKNSL
ncbi:(d)CMP kinase [Neobittarella massiliensis]|uniref:Cytidylate kinase n=1 Tax=Neobittarella massiliensis (ex Bilen et al. 2018) TaxID=2041842 RepID=A0A8J6LVJ7_9FIRM|nr:(d)CMP kinase [Neobittarella massiliensis]MBC3516405.1 (d)CMP kinase [Neobittarella massiliensis]